MKLTKLIFAAGVIMLMGIGCAKTPATNTNTNAPVPDGATSARPASGQMTVRILTDGSFEPTSAFVKVGTAVTFKNDSDKPHWVASNPHPSHTDLPSLDSKAAFGPGQSYTYTFDKAGRWLYHDHTNPAFGGAVVVSE